MKNNPKNLSLLGSALLASTVCSQGAISFVDSIIDLSNTTRTNNVIGTITETEVTQWSDTNFTKTLDIDSDGRYGTDGVALFSTTAPNAPQGDQVQFTRQPTFTSIITNLNPGESNGEFPQYRWNNWFYPK